MVENSSDSESDTVPKLSIVVTSRNDDHGGNCLDRMQVFSESLVEQCKRFQLNVELIIVDWNPPADRSKLHEVIRLSTGSTHMVVRFVEVPEQIHNKIENSDKIQLYQYIAKNVGIRRATGQFVLATNIDILFSDELMSVLTNQQLDENSYYRIDRHDVDSEVVQHTGVQAQLAFCRRNIIRVQGLFGTKAIAQMSSDHFVYTENETKLHTNACGDFLLMARSKWFAFRGYPELPRGDMYVDGLTIYMAHVSGLGQVVFPEPIRIYHIEHEDGWAITRKSPVRTSLSLDYNKEYMPLCRQMVDQRRPIISNDENWGYASLRLKEYNA